jgi:hypothetical protein
VTLVTGSCEQNSKNRAVAYSRKSAIFSWLYEMPRISECCKNGDLSRSRRRLIVANCQLLAAFSPLLHREAGKNRMRSRIIGNSKLVTVGSAFQAFGFEVKYIAPGWPERWVKSEVAIRIGVA